MTDSFNTWGIFYTHCAIWTLKSAINLDDCGSEKIFFLHIAADCGEDRKTFSDEAKFECICTEMLKLGQKCKFLSFNQFHVNCSKIIGFCNAMLSPPFLGQITSDFSEIISPTRTSDIYQCEGDKGKVFQRLQLCYIFRKQGGQGFQIRRQQLIQQRRRGPNYDGNNKGNERSNGWIQRRRIQRRYALWRSA